MFILSNPINDNGPDLNTRVLIKTLRLTLVWKSLELFCIEEIRHKFLWTDDESRSIHLVETGFYL